MSDQRPIRRALVSVYDKTNLADLGRALAAAGVEIVSTGSTAGVLSDVGVAVTRVEDLTGFPECLGGRVKTLHPRVHAGLLADMHDNDHVRQLEELGIAPFDLVVSNLYPFRRTVESGASPAECVEQIDIGGPSMVRAAAKNHACVAVVVSPGRYGEVLEAVRSGGFSLEQRKRLAAEAFAHTASYDAAVANWFARVYAPADDGFFPVFAAETFRRADVLRYGENPHQLAALYVDEAAPAGLAHAEQLHGKQMSYNNYVDTDAARRAAYDFGEVCVAVVKHANPCGIAIGVDVAEAHRKAHACDPVSAYGGVIAANRPVSVEMAEQVAKIFTEVICAPEYEEGALDILLRRKNLRVLRCAPDLRGPDVDSPIERKAISGGVLAQTADRIDAPGDDPSTWSLAAGTAVDDATMADLVFAWRAIRSTKSNAILLAADQATVGVGMGQVNRVDAAKLAVARAGERTRRAVAASDAFFPFADGFEVLAQAGVRAVVEPGGSIRDEEVIEAARTAGVALYFTGTRHFFH